MKKECQQKIVTSAFISLLDYTYCPKNHIGVYLVGARVDYPSKHRGNLHLRIGFSHLKEIGKWMGLPLTHLKPKKTNKHYFRSAKKPCGVLNAAFLQLMNWDTTFKATFANQEWSSCSRWRWKCSSGFAFVKNMVPGTFQVLEGTCRLR